MKNNEFYDFLTGREEVPANLKLSVQKDIQLSFRKNSILGRFMALQILGAFLSLIFCPQFGLGFSEGHGITHVFRMLGDWACACFCGTLFLSSGALLATGLMNKLELWWLMRHYRLSLLFIPAVLWGALMFTDLDIRFSSETLTYHVAWISAGVGAQFLWLQLNKRIFHFQSVFKNL